MFADELRRAIASASRLSLDALATLMWDACANARISEAETEELATLIDVRRNPEGRRSPEAQTLPIPARVPGTGSRPKTPESLTRRRRVAACGRLPPSLACHFTQGEVAVLSVVASDAMQDGACRACLADIGDRAGVSRSTVKNALRQAKALKLITVEERRLTYWRNLTNIVEIVSPRMAGLEPPRPQSQDPKDRSPRDSAAGGGVLEAKPPGTRAAGGGANFRPAQIPFIKNTSQHPKQLPKGGRATLRTVARRGSGRHQRCLGPDFSRLDRIRASRTGRRRSPMPAGFPSGPMGPVGL